MTPLLFAYFAGAVLAFAAWLWTGEGFDWSDAPAVLFVAALWPLALVLFVLVLLVMAVRGDIGWLSRRRLVGVALVALVAVGLAVAALRGWL